jgi:DNA-binding CsgD family transcriptional regulator
MEPPIQFFAAEVGLATQKAGRGATLPTALLERDAELAEIERLLEQAGGGAGGLLIVEGLAGAGKTALLQAASSVARARGTVVLEASGTELERELGFGVVRGLFERMLLQAGSAKRRTLLSGAASLATPVVWPRKSYVTTDPRSVMHGLYWLVSNLAEHGPLMVVVDDAHWADRPSLRFLAYLARRLTGLAALLVVAMRPHEPGGQGELLSALSAEPAAEVLGLAALSEAAVGRLVAERLAADPAGEFVAACHAATGGNPFLVGELIRALSGDRVAATPDNAPRVSQIGPKSVSRTVIARVSRVGRQAMALTEAVAVLGGGDLRHCAALAGLDQDAAAHAFDVLSQIGVLRPGRPVQFFHPLVHAAVSESISPGRRSLLHRAAARLLAEEGSSPERVALHLLNTEPAGQPWLVEALRAAAAAETARGAPDEAAAYLRRALDEPPQARERTAVLHQLGAAELMARDPAATQHLAQALDSTGDPAERGEIGLLLGRAAVSGGRLADARELLGPLIKQLQTLQPDVVAQLEAYWAASWLWDGGSIDGLGPELPRLRHLAERAGPAGRPLLLMIAFRAAQEGRRPEEMLALVERGLDQGRLLESESAEAIAITWAARVLLFIDELDRADHLLDEMVDDSRRRGSVMGYATAGAWRADLALRRGLVATAEAEARSAVELIGAHGLHFISPQAHSFLGEALIEQGELDQAAALFERADLGPMQRTGPEGRFTHTRARLCLARGDKPGAVAIMRAWEREHRVPWIETPNAMPWRSTLALALPASARKEALELIDLELERARRVGLPRAIGVALRARALLCKGPEQISLLNQALAELEASPSRLEHARVLTDLGAALRRASRLQEARQVLARALDLAAACGARALAARAREELVTAGARPRRERLTGVESLTASERRVAQMAATGMTNREIAQALFVTIKAVALHMTHVYEKLDIAGRAELPDALAKT